MRFLLTFLLALALQSGGLGASLSADSNVARPGQVRTFTTVITSDQPVSSHVDLIVPEGYTLLSVTPSNGKCASFGCNGTAGPAAPLTLTATVKVANDAPAGPATITALVTDNLRRSANASLEVRISQVYQRHLPVILH